VTTEDIVGQGGRAEVVQILNGSRSKKVREEDWDQLPDYGRLKHLTGDAFFEVYVRRADEDVWRGFQRAERGGMGGGNQVQCRDAGGCATCFRKVSQQNTLEWAGQMRRFMGEAAE